MTEPAAESQPETAWELQWRLNKPEQWRFDQLRDAGFGYLDAVELAVNPLVDLHEACDMVRRGCLPETALKILS